MSKKIEQNLQTKILKDLNSLGKCCVAFDVMKCSEGGVPDVFFTTVVTGPVLVEVKKPGGVLSRKQEDMIANLNDCGCKSFVVWNWSDWVAFKKVIGLVT